MRKCLCTALRAVLLPATLAITACNDFLTVSDGTVIDAAGLDPARDGPTLSHSARQELATAYGHLITYAAWFSGEALVADFLPDRNQFGRREVLPVNAFLLSELWAPLSTARASADHAIALLARDPDTRTSAHMARAALVAGYAFVFMAEQFCQGAVNGGPPLDANMMLDSAVQRFTQAIATGRTAAQAASGPVKLEAEQIAGAALVGRARAHLQAGRKADAMNDTDQVPAAFTYSLPYVDDAANRVRLGNRVWFFTGQRGSLAVAPAFRDLKDPRVPTRAPDPSRRANDGVTEFWTQAKYTSFAAPIRLASRTEADYIAAEARGAAAMLALIELRRAANGQPPYAGPVTESSLLAVLMDERVRDFYLEAKALGDLRRNPGSVHYTPPPGAPYHKPGFGPIGGQTCYPLPEKETANNPNFPKS